MFAATNVDDLFLLSLFFAKRQSMRRIVEVNTLALPVFWSSACLASGIAWDTTARATELSVEEVRQHWVAGMLRVRELLPREFFEEHH